jgi:conjugal transfer pilus assembly protein TraU
MVGMRWRKLVSVLLAFLILVQSVPANPAAKAVCRAGPDTSLTILVTIIGTAYNAFPITIGGVKFNFWFNLEDVNNMVGSFPLCICYTPFPRVGIKFGIWEGIAVMEPVRIPWCTPTLPIPGGLTGKVLFNAQAIGGANSDDQKEGELRSFQVHYYKALPWALIGLFLDFACLESNNPFDLAYMTELDPLWQSDMLASILGPEAILVANPIAQMACAIDAMTSTAGFPLDPLFWCMGAWGSMYPMSESIPLDNVQANAGVVARMLFKLHRELVLWGSFGKAGLCGRYPMPIMFKSQYSIYPIWPILYPKRFPIGRHAFVIWGWGKNVPVLNQLNNVWMVYRKRDCCAF